MLSFDKWKLLIYPTKDCVNEVMTGIRIEIYGQRHSTYETTLVPPTITVEGQMYHKSTIISPHNPPVLH